MLIGPDDAHRAQSWQPLRLPRAQAHFCETPPQLMHRCPACQAPRLHLMDCQRAPHASSAEERWTLAVRCPDCAWRYQGVFGTQQLFALVDAMEAAFDSMLGHLQALRAQRHEAEIQRFAQALAADAVMPEDF